MDLIWRKTRDTVTLNDLDIHIYSFIKYLITIHNYCSVFSLDESSIISTFTTISNLREITCAFIDNTTPSTKVIGCMPLLSINGNVQQRTSLSKEVWHIQGTEHCEQIRICVWIYSEWVWKEDYWILWDCKACPAVHWFTTSCVNINLQLCW